MIDRLNAALAGRYRIERELGEGGMATVYLAHDLKHDRQVAIKVLKPELAAVIGAERFLAEIRTTANLQHPHILPLFDSGEADALLYYVMPYIEGETVRDRLDRERQLGVEEAVAIAADVGDALDYAHRQGVIHRDIKPGNILLHDGRPLVADFGIALAVSAAGGRLTETGLSLGTPHYMSPEQATADSVPTPRSDVYSLGAVLYEMLTGDPPHTAPTAQAVVMKILTEEAPPVTAGRKSVPPNVADATARALEKLPADRFESAARFAEALRTPSFRYRAGTVGGGAGRPRARTAASAAGWIVAAILAAVVLWLAAGAEPPAPAPSYAFEIDDLGQGNAEIAITDDGTVLYSVGREIRVRTPAALEPVTLHVDQRNVNGISASPDGRWVAFRTFGDNEAGLYRIPVAGGSPTELLGDAAGTFPVWGHDGWIYLGHRDGLVRVPEDGGAIDTVRSDPRLRPSDALPGGRGLLMTRGRSVMVLDLASGDTATVVADGRFPRWSDTGHIVYVHPEGTLFALPFSLSEFVVTGEPREVLDGVSGSAIWFDISGTGTLAYQVGAPGIPRWGRAEYWWVSADGGQERIPIRTVDGHTDGELSPEGRRVAYVRGDDIHVFDLDLGTDAAVAPGHHDPVWSPDGRLVAYRDDQNDGVWAAAADGSGEPYALASFAATSPVQWLPDGTVLLGSFSRNVYAVDDDPGTDAPPRDVFVADWQEFNATISPDGRWIAYGSDEDGVARAYLRSWPGLRGRALISGADTVTLQGESLQWASDSRGLYYVRTDGTVVLATLAAGRVSRRSPVVDLGRSSLQDMDAVGQRFLVSRSAVDGAGPDGVPEPNRLVVVTGWFDELRRRMGQGG